jgi:FkbM family methyltransferase
LDQITLEARHGYSISVPASLHCITTYVLLEQERWFEPEIDFLLSYLRPEMMAIDIGANLGVYSLPLAMKVGQGGAVYSYEPGSEARKCLLASIALNGLENVRVSSAALSNCPGRLWLAHGNSSELHELKAAPEAGAPGEMVDVVTLDSEQQAYAWTRVDFVKIDAEGQEARIVVGGRDFFSKHSPLVMYEVMDAGQVNRQLRWVFEALGYQTYRLSGDSSYLIRIDGDYCGDDFDLNYFSAKTDRAARMVEAGLLVDRVEQFVFSSNERAAAQNALLGQPFALELEFNLADLEGNEPYTSALLAYAAYQYLSWPAVRKHAALTFAYEHLSALSVTNPSMEILTTFSRVAASLNHRTETLQILGLLRAAIEQGDETVLDVPFFPAAARFEHVRPVADIYTWFRAAIIDSWVRLSAHSTRFAPEDGGMAAIWLVNSGYADAEVRRRAGLWEIVRLGRTSVASGAAETHLNPRYWAADALEARALARMPV